MSSKKFVYLLIAVALVCGFIMGDTAHGQSTGSLAFGGSVLDADDNAVPGYTISAEFVPARTGFQILPVSRPDGSYNLAILGFTIGGPPPKINVGDVIKITATHADGSTASVTHTVTAADVASSQVKDLNIVLSGLTVEASPPSIPAHDTNTSTITVTVLESGEGVTGDTIRLSAPADKGTVDATATEVGDGVYTATYTAPSLVLIAAESVDIAVSSATTGLKKSVSILLTPVPTTVSLALGKNSFMADTPETTTVTVTVNRIDPVTDEVVTLSLNPASPEGGSVSAVTSNEDGTYSATYTSGSTAGNVTLTATATKALTTDSAAITVNAGPPANVDVTAAPTIVTSLGSATITAMVTDSNGNAAGGELTAETTSGGTVGEFTSTVFGTYTATYTAPELDVESTETIMETITVSTGDVSGSTTIELLPEDPIDVTILTVEGIVYKEDGEITADEGTEVTVTVAGTPRTTTTDANGYMVLFIGDLISPVATTGNEVSIAVGDATVVGLTVNGTARTGSSFRLVNDILEKVAAGDPIVVDVTTDIVIPPRSVSSLVVEGMAYKEDRITPAGSGLQVVVTVGENTQTVQTEVNGSYQALFIADLITTVATTGDPISVEVSDARVRGTNPPPPEEATLSNKELGTTGSTTVIRNVYTDIKLTTSILAVGGTVYLKNGDTDSIAAAKHLRETELTVVATNTTRNIEMTGSVDDEGQYELLFVGPNLSTVAETDDEIVVEVQNDAGVGVGSSSHIVTIANINETRADIDVDTTVPARVLALHVEGDVVELDGSSAGPGVEVTLMIVMNGSSIEADVVTDAAGRYRHLFAAVSPEAPAARTDDILRVQVLRVANGYFGYREMELRTDEIVYENQPLIVMPPIQLIPPTLRLGGLSINTSHADQYYGYLSLEAIKKNPELLQLIPSGILHIDLAQNLLGSLPAGFNPAPEPTADITKMYEIDSENFGNGLTPRPAWHVLAGSSPADSGRWLNGNQLNLYVVTGPIPSVQSVTFTLTGPGGGTMEAEPVAADGYTHNFQLEEERAILFLPSWPSLNANAPIFSGVTLMIDGQAPMPMTSTVVGDEVVWEAPTTLTAGATVAYHYQVTLAQPYELDDGTVVSSWPMPDPRNLQVENRGIVETLLAPDVPELKEIVTTTDLKLRSVFDVPAPGANESLWVATFDFDAGADGAYSVDTVVQYEGGLVRNIPNQMFTLDRAAPAAGITAAIGESAGLYQRADGSYVTAAHTDAGTLNLMTMPMDVPSESAAYLYQIIELDAEGNPGNQVWNPITVTGEMLPLTYMDPHQVQIPIGDVGNYGIRAVGVDSILNIASNTMPRMVDIVPPDPDVAELTLVHADFIKDGVFGREQSVSDGVTIFSDLSPVTLTFGMAATDHPLTSVVVDFQIDGEGDWKQIAMLTGDALAAAKAGFEVTWDRTDDFAALLDMRGTATVRVTVANALDIEDESTATLEVVPPALLLGGLSLDTSYAETHADAWNSMLELDLTGLLANMLQTDPYSLISPSLLPIGLAFIGILGEIDIELPAGFEPDNEQIHQENFGNAITPRPIWYPLASQMRDPGRWINGNQLHLYTLAGPTAESVTFSITGAGSAMAEATKVEADGSFMYTFQLEEELLAIFAGSMPAFESVTLMIDHHAPTAMELGDGGVWSAEVPLTPDSTVSYYYIVKLAQPYQDPLMGRPIQVFPLPDPRNLQVREGSIHALMKFLIEGFDSLPTLDSGVRSRFAVPAVDTGSQSLWVGKLDLTADGMHQVNVAVQYSGGSTDELTGKMLNVDRTAPTADTMVDADAPGENIGMYLRAADGQYVATALPNPGAASLDVTAVPIDDSDLEVYLYQMARLDDAGYPGTWNPILTLDLLGGDLTQLLMNPAGILPLTSMPPHHVQMLVRSEAGSMLDYGAYGLRVVGVDNILNADSSRGPGVVLNLVPPDPDIAEVTYVTSDFDGNNVIEGLEMQSAAGDIVVYSESLVTLTVEVKERTDHPLVSVVLEYQIPGSGWLPIGGFGPEQLAGVGLGDSLQVPLPVPDIPLLPDRGAQVMLRTVTTNALDIVNEHVVTAQYERRLEPSVSAIYADVTDRHPDSGAAQGSITVSAFTQAMTNLPTAVVQLEIRRTADTDWMPLGVVQIAESTVTSHVNLAIIDGLVNSIVNGAPTAPISVLYRQWPLPIDSALLADTILDDTPAASDASLDDNPYVLRAIAVDTAGTGYESADGKGFSLDNYSPTAITTVANEVEAVAPRADGSYYVSGLLHESVPDPMLTLTTRTGAHPNGFTGGMALAVNDASGTAVEIPATAFTAAGYHNYTGVFNLASIPNGMYTFRAVAHAADGSPEERIVAMEITVEVGNFTPPENFADPTVDILSVINTQGDARSPSEIDAEYTTGFPATEEKVTATLMVPNVSAGDLDVLIGDDLMSAAAMDSLMVMQMEGSIDNVIMVDTSGLEEGMHGLVGVVIKPNGSIQFALPSIRVDRTGPEIAIVSPTERDQITGLPTVHVTFSDATGFDVTDTDPRHAVLTLTRLGDEVEIDITETLIRLTAAADGEILTRDGDIVYTHDDSLIGGAYRIGATVMDVLGNATTAEPVEFTVEGVQPTVSIVSPSAGHIIDPRQPLIVSVALTGNGDITVTEFQINGNDLEGTVEDGWLTYTMQPPLVDESDSVLQRGSDNTISVKIVDSEGRTAEGATGFAVSLDSTPPVISGPSPKGDITRKIGRITALVTDNESDITRIQYALDDSPLTDISFSPARVYEVGGGKEVKGQTSFNLFDAPLGTHTVTIVAESTGGTTTLTWEFTIVHPDQKPPEVVTYSPLGIIRTDRPVLAATVSDESGFARDGITLILAGVPGNQGSGRRSSPTSTTVTFTPSISVTPGPYTARLTVVDKYNNRTEAEWQFTVELDETPPSITATAPHGVIHMDKPIITVSASDDRSGVDSIAITAKDSGGLPVNGVTDVRSDKTAATFTPTQALKDGVYTVDVKVADQAGNEASARWQFTVDLDLIPPSILITRPSQEHTENRRPVISAAYTDNMSGVDVDSIKLTLDGTTVEPDDVSETQVVFTPGYDLPFGEHTVSIELADSAPKANSTVHEWTFYVERIGIADARNYPNPFDHDTTITFRISRQAKITVRVYDFTGRLVATPVANSIREAGVVEIDWHGQTSAGDHLARGVYFCHILMESELEPQSAILKMAIVAD